jgi:CheY-like chemotaxis protein
MAEQRTLLIIDDSEDEIRLTERILSRIFPAIKVESAMSGEEGLALLRSCRMLPVLTLLDLKMPGISGFETLRRIRADERLKNLPVVIVTNSNLESDRTKALAAGADVFLHKAFDVDRFSRDIQSLLQKFPAD